MSRFCNQKALECGSGLYSPLFPRFAIACEESAYRVKGDVLHPPLIAVRREGESHSFEPFVRRYERPQGFGLEVLRSLDFHGNDGRPFLHKEIDFHGGIGRATLFPTSFRPNTTFFPTSFKQGYAFFRTSSGGVGAGIDRVAGIVKEMQNDDIWKFNEKATLYCLVLSNIELGKLTVAPSICPVRPY